MVIALDFDGTIVEHKYPAIGEEIPFATETIRMLIAERHKVSGIIKSVIIKSGINNFAFSKATLPFSAQ